MMVYVFNILGSNIGYSSWTLWFTICNKDLDGFQRLVVTTSVEIVDWWELLDHSGNFLWLWNSLLHHSLWSSIWLCPHLWPWPFLRIPLQFFIFCQSGPMRRLVLLNMHMEAWMSNLTIKEAESTLNLCGLHPITYSQSSDEAALAWKVLILCLLRLFPTLETCPFFLIGQYMFFSFLLLVLIWFVGFLKIDPIFYPFLNHHFNFSIFICTLYYAHTSPTT